MDDFIDALADLSDEAIEAAAVEWAAALRFAGERAGCWRPE